MVCTFRKSEKIVMGVALQTESWTLPRKKRARLHRNAYKETEKSEKKTSEGAFGEEKTRLLASLAHCLAVALHHDLLP